MPPTASLMAGFAPPISKPAEPEELQSAAQPSETELEGDDVSHVAPNSVASQWLMTAQDPYDVLTGQDEVPGVLAPHESVDPVAKVGQDVDQPDTPADERATGGGSGGEDGGAGDQGGGGKGGGGPPGATQDTEQAEGGSAKQSGAGPDEKFQPAGKTAPAGRGTDRQGAGGGGAGGGGGGAAGGGGGGSAGGAGGGASGPRGAGAAASTLALDDRVRQAIEGNQDPTAASQHDNLLIKADMARLAALQYSYSPNDSFLKGFAKTLLPLDQMGERITSMWSGNQYASAANADNASGRIAKVQAVIETVRQALRLAGDVVGAGATVLSYVGIISGLIGLIPPAAPIALPIAAFSASMSLTLTAIKVGLDLLDAALGAVQIALLVWRARTASGKDPAERARIAMLLRREAGEVTTSLTSAGVGWLTHKLGTKALKLEPPGQAASSAVQAAAVRAGLSRAGRRLIGGDLRRAFSRETFKELRAVSQSIKLAQAVAKPTFGTLGSVVLNTKNVDWTVFSDVYHREMAANAINAARAGRPWHTQAKIWVAGKIRTSVVPKIPSLTKKLPATGTKFAVGRGQREGEVSGASHHDPLAASAGSGAIEETGPAATYLYWPSVLERYATMRVDIKAARERAQTQHELARKDAGASGDAVIKVKATSARVAGKLAMAGRAVGAEANVDDQAASLRATLGEKAAKGTSSASDAQTRSDNERAAALREADDANQQSIELARQARENPGWFARIKAWTFRKLGNAMRAMQETLTEWILSAALAGAGIKPEDLDVDAINATAEADRGSAGEAKTDGEAITAAEALERKGMEQLLKGASDNEQNAIHGVADTLDYMRDLDDWDEMLRLQQLDGTSYVSNVAAALLAEMEEANPVTEPPPVEPTAEERSEDVVDERALASITSGAAYVTGAATGVESFHTTCLESLSSQLATVRSEFAPYGVDLDMSGATLAGRGLIGDARLGLEERLQIAARAAADVAGVAAGLPGSTDHAAVRQLEQEMAKIVAEVDAAYLDANRIVGAALQQILDACVAAGADAILGPDMSAPDDASSPDASTPLNEPLGSTPAQTR